MPSGRESPLAVREVCKPLRGDPEPAYTTVMTTLDRLFKKGLLLRHKEGIAFVYAPAMSKDEYQRRRVEQTISGWLTQKGGSQSVLAAFVDTAADVDVTNLRAARGAHRRTKEAREVTASSLIAFALVFLVASALISLLVGLVLRSPDDSCLSWWPNPQEASGNACSCWTSHALLAARRFLSRRLDKGLVQGHRSLQGTWASPYTSDLMHGTGVGLSLSVGGLATGDRLWLFVYSGAAPSPAVGAREGSAGRLALSSDR